ncbi:MAG: hypothetical protein DWQ36_18805 [Acidobacteria bacterium]|nr:MAG: hypothetical protein DWQ30_03635 [Acidobacteriota bacterium]REK03824.1 MAG: hypothetical protein DWQ36_18805 [Acidobacteriota bacterium]
MRIEPRAGLVAAVLAASLAATALPAASAEVAASATEIRPLLIGAQAPDVAVQALDGSEVELKDILAKQRSVLVFYRGGW